MILAAISRRACSARARRANLLARFGDRLDQAGVLDRDRRLVGERLHERDLLGIEGAGLRPAHLEHAQHALLAGERRDDEGPDAIESDGLVKPGIVLEPRILEVLRADDGLPGRDRLSGGAKCERAAFLVDRSATDEVAGARKVSEADPPRGGHHEVDPHPFGAEKAGDLVDDVLEDLHGVADGGDPGGDLAKGALGVCPSAEFRPGAVQLLDQAWRSSSRSPPDRRGPRSASHRPG